MDGETAVVASKDSSCLDDKLEGLEEEWRGSRHQGSAATLVFQRETGASIIIFWAMLPQIDVDNITCTICVTIVTEKTNNGSSHTIIDALWSF